MEKSKIIQINRHVLLVVSLLFPLYICGQSIKYQDVDSMLIKFSGYWGNSACIGTVVSAFIMYPNKEYLFTDRKNIKKLVKCVNKLGKEKDDGRSCLFDVECMVYFFHSDTISSVLTVNENYANIDGHRHQSGHLPSIITKICDSPHERQSRQTLVSNYLPYDGGDSVLRQYIEMKLGEMDMEECPSGEYDLVISCHADKMGSTTNVSIFHSSHNPKKNIPKLLHKYIENLFYQLKWIEDKTRLPSDDIIMKLLLIVK